MELVVIHKYNGCRWLRFAVSDDLLAEITIDALGGKEKIVAVPADWQVRYSKSEQITRYDQNQISGEDFCERAKRQKWFVLSIGRFSTAQG